MNNHLETLGLGVENIPLPDSYAGQGEAQAHQAVPHQGVGHGAQEAAHSCRICEILAYVHTKILQC